MKVINISLVIRDDFAQNVVEIPKILGRMRGVPVPDSSKRPCIIFRHVRYFDNVSANIAIMHRLPVYNGGKFDRRCPRGSAGDPGRGASTSPL